MNKLIFKKMEILAAASPIAAHVDLFNEGEPQAEVILYDAPSDADLSRELKRAWVRTVTEMKALLVEWEAELDKRGIVR